MNNLDYYKKIIAIEKNDLKTMKKLCEHYTNDYSLKFEYAKLLLHNELIDDAKAVLLELLNTNNKIYAMFELGKIELEQNNYYDAKYYFTSILKIKDDIYTKKELGKLEANFEHYDEAREIFESILKVKNDPHTVLELGKLEFKLKNYSKARRHFKALSKSVLEPSIIPHALLELGFLEANVGDTLKAKEYLKSIEEESYLNLTNNLIAILEYKDKNYLEAFKIIKECSENNSVRDYRILLGLSKELNIFFNIDYTKIDYKYSMDQVLNYDYNDAIDHIVSHHCEEKKDFNENVDIEKLCSEIKDELTEENKINVLTFNDVYVVFKKGIGSKGENYLKVVTLPNTKDIITMYPLYNEIIEEEDYSKILMKNKGN